MLLLEQKLLLRLLHVGLLLQLLQLLQLVQLVLLSHHAKLNMLRVAFH
jgi:hypothetical protein